MFDNVFEFRNSCNDQKEKGSKANDSSFKEELYILVVNTANFIWKIIETFGYKGEATYADS